MSMLFSHPKIPRPPMPNPPQPVQNTELTAQLTQLGRQQGLLSALYGMRNKGSSATSTSAHTITGQ